MHFFEDFASFVVAFFSEEPMRSFRQVVDPHHADYAEDDVGDLEPDPFFGDVEEIYNV